MTEIQEATAFPVRGADVEECRDEARLAGSAVVALYAQAEGVRAALPKGTTPLLLHTRSVPDSLRGEQPPPSEALVSVVSRWGKFLEWSHVVLVAAGLDASALSFRDAREEGWERGLRTSALIITDALTARSLPYDCHARVFRIVADSSLEELRSFVGQFLTIGPPADA
jgi:hypothetical protein